MDSSSSAVVSSESSSELSSSPVSSVGSSSVAVVCSSVGSSTSSAPGVSSVTPGSRTPLAAAAGVGSKGTQPYWGPNQTSGQAWAFLEVTDHSSPSNCPAVKPMATRVG